MMNDEKQKEVDLYSPIQIPYGIYIFRKYRLELLLIPIALILLLSIMLTDVLHVKEIPVTIREIIKAYQYDNVGVVIGNIVVLRYLMQMCLIVFSAFSLIDASYSFCQVKYSTEEVQKIIYQNNMILALISGFILAQPAAQSLTKLIADYSDNFTVVSLTFIGIAITSILLFRYFFIRVVGRCEFEQKMSASLNRLLNMPEDAFERLCDKLATSYPEENLDNTLEEFRNIRAFVKNPEEFLEDTNPEEGVQIGEVKMPDIDMLLRMLEIESNEENYEENENQIGE